MKAASVFAGKLRYLNLGERVSACIRLQRLETGGWGHCEARKSLPKSISPGVPTLRTRAIFKWTVPDHFEFKFNFKFRSEDTPGVSVGVIQLGLGLGLGSASSN